MSGLSVEIQKWIEEQLVEMVGEATGRTNVHDILKATNREFASCSITNRTSLMSASSDVNYSETG